VPDPRGKSAKEGGKQGMDEWMNEWTNERMNDWMESLQAHFAKFTGRDAAMSKSLNSDYLSQLYIRADTKSMDKDLVRDEVATSGLPEEAQALVVFKRGCVFLLNLSI